MVNVGASAGRGNADGADTWWTNTHLDAGNRISLDSGGDTSLIGAVARAGAREVGVCAGRPLPRAGEGTIGIARVQGLRPTCVCIA